MAKAKKSKQATSHQPGAQSAPWRNRIVGHAEVSPTELIANDRNWRTHSAEQIDALAAMITDIGFVRSVTVNKLTGRIVDGHARVALAMKQSQPQISVEYVELSDDEEAKALATLDPLSMMAGVDEQQLRGLAESMDFNVPGMEGLQQQLESLLAESAGDAVQVDEDGQGGNGTGGQGAKEQFKIVVECTSERHQCQLLKKLRGLHLKCSASVR